MKSPQKYTQTERDDFISQLHVSPATSPCHILHRLSNEWKCMEHQSWRRWAWCKIACVSEEAFITHPPTHILCCRRLMYAVMSNKKTAKRSLNNKDITGEKHTEHGLQLFDISIKDYTLKQGCLVVELHSRVNMYSWFEDEPFCYFIS